MFGSASGVLQSRRRFLRCRITLRKSGSQSISASSIVTDTTYYRSYRISDLPTGQWQLILPQSRSAGFTFDLHVSCSSGLRCFSRMFVDNGNPVHPGQVELYGNPIEGQAVLLMSTCDSNTVDVQTVQVTLIDSSNGQITGSDHPVNVRRREQSLDHERD